MISNEASYARLPSGNQIEFKLATLAFRTVRGLAPPYLSNK